MHARDLVQLAALVAIHSPQIVASRGRIEPTSQEPYWTASRLRLDRWTRLLRKVADSSGHYPLPATLSWPRVRPVLEEILLSEPLVRIWAATATALDNAQGTGEAAPVARAVLMGQHEARRRLLQILADGRALDALQAATLNRLRQRLERWTDMLLAHLVPHTDVSEFAFDAGRAADFSADLADEAESCDAHLASRLALSSLQATLFQMAGERGPNADLNRRIGSAIVAALSETSFVATGLANSLWLERISTLASDAEGLIEELLRIDNVPSIQ
jgi:hypothetical protein